jgi:uncharacterized protein DUF3775
MPAINLDKAGYIIVKARDLGAKVDPEDPEPSSNRSDDLGIDMPGDFADDPTREQLPGASQSLNAYESLNLVALVRIGRGSYERNEAIEARRQAAEIPQAYRPRHLTGTPMVGDFLEQGLAAIGLYCAETEAAHL